MVGAARDSRRSNGRNRRDRRGAKRMNSSLLRLSWKMGSGRLPSAKRRPSEDRVSRSVKQWKRTRCYRRLRRACGGRACPLPPPLQGLRTLQPQGVGAQGLAPLPIPCFLLRISPQAAESLRRESMPAPSSAAGSLHPAASRRRGARPCAPTDPLFLASYLTAGCGEPAAGMTLFDPYSAVGSLHPAVSGRRGARPCAPTDPSFLA